MVSGTQDYIADIACKTDIHVSLFNVIYIWMFWSRELKKNIEDQVPLKHYQVHVLFIFK